MPTDVIMPQMGESIFEGTITKWLKKVGEPVEKDEPLFEISTDKVDAEIPSPVAGVLTEIKFPEGATVEINTVVAVLSENGSGAPQKTTEKPAAKPASPVAVQPLAQPKVQPAPEVKPAPAVSVSSGGGVEVVMPQMGESIFEGTITKWLKKVGDSVEKDEPLFEISTDKVDAEIPSPVAGVLSEIRAGEGETVQINLVVAVIGGTSGAGGRGFAATGGRAPPSLMCRRMSSLLMRPFEPVPGTMRRSTPCSFAIRRTSGDDLMRPVWIGSGSGTCGAAGVATALDGFSVAEIPAAVVLRPAPKVPPITATTTFI